MAQRRRQGTGGAQTERRRRSNDRSQRPKAQSVDPRFAWYVGLALVALFEIIDWPVALVIGVGHEIAYRARSRALRELAEGSRPRAEREAGGLLVPFRAQARPQQILERVLRRHPALERHAARAGDCQPVSVRRLVAHRRREFSVLAMKHDEVVKFGGEVHRRWPGGAMAAA